MPIGSVSRAAFVDRTLQQLTSPQLAAKPIPKWA